MASYDSPTPRQFHNPSGERAFRARNRAARQKRVAIILVVSILALAVLLSVLARRTAPLAPRFSLSWPQSYGFGSREIAPGETVLLRRGTPLLVSVQNAAQWNLTTENAAAEKQSASPTVFAWSPDDLDAGQETFLDVTCAPQPGGWRGLFAWQWPIHTIRLKGIAGVKVGAHGQRISPPSGTRVLVASRVLADGPALWDDRAVALLESAAQENNIALWKLRPTFSGKTLSSDGATYALFNAAATERDLAAQASKVAQTITKAAPNASIKYIARLDAKPQNTIFRLAFDGKKSRAGWVKKPGVEKAESVTW